MEKVFFSPEPVIFSAMGGVKTLPPETLENFKEGFENGADVACINIQLSKDNIVMVMTPENLEPVCGAAGKVSDYNACELKQMDAGYMFRDQGGEYSYRGKGYAFVTLKELFEAFPENKFSVNLLHKNDTLVKVYAETVKSCGAENRVITSSMHSRNIKLVRQILPGGATSFSLPGIIGVYALFKSGLIFFKRSFAADALQTPEAIGVSYIANNGLIREMHKRGIKVYVWYINSKEQYIRVRDSGADGYMSDDIPLLKSFMKV